MYDTELESLLQQIDTATNQLAAINSSEDPKLSRQKGQLCRKLSALNAAAAHRYTQVYLAPRPPVRVAPRIPRLYLQLLLYSAMITTMVVFVGVVGYSWFQALAASFASLAHPVP